MHNNYSGTDAVHIADMPEGVTDVKSLRIGSDYTNTARQCIVDNIEISTSEGETGLIPYSINYMLDGETIRTKSAMVPSGTVVTAESEFIYGDIKYFVLDTENAQMTVTEDAENILNVDIRTAETYTVTVKAGGDLDKTIREYRVTEGDGVSYVFPRYMIEDNTLYITQPNEGTYYGGTIEEVRENTIIDIDYLEMYDTCVLYDELDSSTGDNAAVRASNGSAFQNEEYSSSKEITPGKYTFIVGYLSKGRGSKLMIGDTVIKEIGLAEERGSWRTATVENVEITESGYITLAAGGGGTRDCLDTVVAISEDPLPEEPELYENRIKSIDKNEEKVNVKISLETEDTGTLLCSMYDIDGNLIKVCSEDVTKDISNYSFDISDCETVRTVKAFLWDGAETMKPIAQTKDFEILITQKV